VQQVQSEVLGEEALTTLVGYVRNTVPTPGPGYPWPVPRACFAVFHREVDPGVPFGGGHWLSLDEAADHLTERHWWPLLPEFFSHPGRGSATYGTAW
jgi:hypothetical protein